MAGSTTASRRFDSNARDGVNDGDSYNVPVTLSSNPYRRLIPVYSQLRSQGRFALLSPHHSHRGAADRILRLPIAMRAV